ncbi:Cytochrome P450 89A2 [Triticum urartu]|uniref:Cytochrome P450 89A2 n=1 Tax=Triticum urartu TaxID=4572 RepID=M7ZAM7_TRIUA|nr:Cytochrome P450 89A2 [Triticum urartu]
MDTWHIFLGSILLAIPLILLLRGRKGGRLRRGATLADRPALPSLKLLGENNNTITRASYGPVWRLLRRNLVSETLHPSRVRLFAPARSWVRRVLAEKLRDESSSGGAAVVETFQYAMFCLLVLMCFGERLDEATVRAIAAAQRELLIYRSRKMAIFSFLPSVTKHLYRDRLQTVHAMQRRKKDLFVPLINARREYRKLGGEPKKESAFEHSYVDALLDIKLPEEGNRPLTDDEMINLCSEFLDAGTDTTSTGLQWIMAELVKNPAIQEKLYEEISATKGDDQDEVSEEDVHKMPYLKAVVLEGLRKHPPAHFVLPHKAAADMEIGGYLIPKGATVNFMVAEMSRDEREWEKPTEFVPERFLPGGAGEAVDVTGNREIKMMPFGVGRRICAGLGIAMLHLEYFVANMVREFEWQEVAGEEVDFAEKNEFTVVMKKPLRPRPVLKTTVSTRLLKRDLKIAQAASSGITPRGTSLQFITTSREGWRNRVKPHNNTKEDVIVITPIASQKFSLKDTRTTKI